MATKFGQIKGNTEMLDAAETTALVAGATTQYFEGVQGASETAAEAIARITSGATVKGGSTAVLKKEISTGKYSFTAYTYDTTTNPESPVWKAMDGNYSPDNVIFDSDLTITADIGVKKVGSSGSATVAATGKSLKQVLASIMAQQKYPSTPTQPSATVTLTNSGAVEAGTKITPAWKTTFSAGSYQFGPATGVTSKAATVYHGTKDDSDADAVAAGSLNNATGTFDEIIVAAGSTFKAKLLWGSTAGATPVTNLGNDATVAQDDCTGSKVSAIAEKTNQTAESSNSITGYRMGRFYGTSTSKIAADDVTSANVRALSKNNGSGTTGDFTMTVPVGAATIIIAVAGTRTLKKVLNTTVNADMTESFVKATNLLSVCGADAPSTANAGDYTVWTFSPAEPYGSTANLTITIA